MMDKKHRISPTDTWRELKDLEPIQNWRCRIGWHQWTNWEVYSDGWSMGNPGHAQCYCACCGMPRIEQPITRKKKNG